MLFFELNNPEDINRVESQFDQLEVQVIKKRLKNWNI